MPSLIERYIDKAIFDVEIRFTEYSGHASEIATAAKNTGVDIVVAVGGDHRQPHCPWHYTLRFRQRTRTSSDAPAQCKRGAGDNQFMRDT